MFFPFFVFSVEQWSSDRRFVVDVVSWDCVGQSFRIAWFSERYSDLPHKVVPRFVRVQLVYKYYFTFGLMNGGYIYIDQRGLCSPTFTSLGGHHHAFDYDRKSSIITMNAPVSITFSPSNPMKPAFEITIWNTSMEFFNIPKLSQEPNLRCSPTKNSSRFEMLMIHRDSPHDSPRFLPAWKTTDHAGSLSIPMKNIHPMG